MRSCDCFPFPLLQDTVAKPALRGRPPAPKKSAVKPETLPEFVARAAKVLLLNKGSMDSNLFGQAVSGSPFPPRSTPQGNSLAAAMNQIPLRPLYTCPPRRRASRCHSRCKGFLCHEESSFVPSVPPQPCNA